MNAIATPASQQLFAFFTAKFLFLTTGPHPASDGGKYIFQTIVGINLALRGIAADPWQLDQQQAAQVRKALEGQDENTLSEIVAGQLRSSVFL